MHQARYSLTAAACALALALACGMDGQAIAAPANEALQAFAQAGSPSTTTRVKGWTRERWEAAKKRWAKNKVQFTDCSNKLAEVKKSKRLSFHDQRHFLEDCMREKP